MGKKRKKAKSSPTPEHRVDALIAATTPLLELFAVADDVFSEDGAMAPENRQKGMGRIYRAWVKARSDIDPDFSAEREGKRQKSEKAQRAGKTEPKTAKPKRWVPPGS